MLLMQLEPSALIFIASLFAGLVGVLFRQAQNSIKKLQTDSEQFGKDITELRTALRFYFERISIGSAKVLDTENPTPPALRLLLRKYRLKQLTDDDKRQMIKMLGRFVDDNATPQSERSAANSFLASVCAMDMLKDRENECTS